MLQQVAVFVENRPGRLVEILQCIAEHGLDIHGLSVADSADFGVFRMILSDPERGRLVLKEAGFIVKFADVLAIDVSDIPGGLYQAVSAISREGINVDYVYAFGTKLSGHAMIIMKTEDDTKASSILEKQGVVLLDPAMMESRLNAEK